jgi:hypothetical protein
MSKASPPPPPRPSGSMCLACVRRSSDCSRLDFKAMPVMRKDKDGTPVVRCSYFRHAPTPH